MKQISQIGIILNFFITIILLLLQSQAYAESINSVDDLISIENANSFLSGSQNTGYDIGSFTQLSATETPSMVDDKLSFHSDDNHAVKLPLPTTVLLFGGALTCLIGFSRRTHKLGGTLSNEYINILGINFATLNYDRAISLFQQWVISKQPHQVCFVNVHTLVSSLNDQNLRAINKKALNTMDGMPVVWYAKLVHGKKMASKLCGPDLMQKCLDEGRKRDWKHFFLGGSEQVLLDLVTATQNRYPGIEIVGWHSPAFRQLSDQEDAELVKLINDAKPDFLWVGLGAPKQELWIASHLERIHVPVQLGVGAAFNFHSGRVKRAPKWMQKSGLEWLYRVYKEKRLFKRYLTTNPVFLYLFIKDFILIRLLKQTRKYL